MNRIVVNNKVILWENNKIPDKGILYYLKSITHNNSKQYSTIISNSYTMEEFSMQIFVYNLNSIEEIQKAKVKIFDIENEINFCYWQDDRILTVKKIIKKVL